MDHEGTLEGPFLPDFNCTNVVSKISCPEIFLNTSTIYTPFYCCFLEHYQLFLPALLAGSNVSNIRSCSRGRMRKYFLVANTKKCVFLFVILCFYYYSITYYLLPARMEPKIYLGNCSREEMWKMKNEDCWKTSFS